MILKDIVFRPYIRVKAIGYRKMYLKKGTSIHLKLVLYL